jgi:hypothetical protein
MNDFLKEADVEISDQDLCKAVWGDIGNDIYPGQICGDAPEVNLGFCDVRNTPA